MFRNVHLQRLRGVGQLFKSDGMRRPVSGRDAVRSQVIDVLKAQIKRRPAMNAQHAPSERFAPRECGWKHGDSGYSAGEKLFSATKKKTHYEPRIPLTPTGLLMEAITLRIPPTHCESGSLIASNRHLNVKHSASYQTGAAQCTLTILSISN